MDQMSIKVVKSCKLNKSTENKRDDKRKQSKQDSDEILSFRQIGS